MFYKELDEESKAKYAEKIEYKGYTYELDYISRKYPNLAKYEYYDRGSKYIINYSTLYYDYAKNKLVAVAYVIRGRYKIPIYDGYASIGCGFNKDLDNELTKYVRVY